MARQPQARLHHVGPAADLVGSGIRGLTSNPTIFQKAIQGSADYDEQFRELAADEHPVARRLLVDGARTTSTAPATCSTRSTTRATAPTDTSASRSTPASPRTRRAPSRAARNLHERHPATEPDGQDPRHPAGRPAIQQMIAEGRSINVTLIFSLDRYQEVMEAYIAGSRVCREATADLSRVASVASFFISRVDTEVDRRLEAIGTPEALALRGKAADRPGQARLPAVPEDVQRDALGGARRPGRPRAAAAVGEHVDEEPRLSRHDVRRQADRPETVEHAARGDDRGVRRPRHAGPHDRRRRRRGRGRVGSLAAVGVDMDDVADQLERRACPASRRASTS